MPLAVRFDKYGDVDVLDVVDVPRPVPGPGQVVVKVMAAGINPGEASIRKGLLDSVWPATFPSGEGSDLAGIVAEVGPNVVRFAVGDEVLGFVETRSSHAEFVVAEVDNLVARPSDVPWDVAGSLFVVGTTAYAAVRAVSLDKGDTVVVSGAAGGVGSLAVQLAVDAGAMVIGLASHGHHDWLVSHGVVPVVYGDGVVERITKASEGQVDAFIDTFGGGYVEMAIALGVAPDRIDTIIDRAAALEFGAKTDGSAAAANTDVLGELAGLIAQGRLEIPIAKTYPTDRGARCLPGSRAASHARQDRPRPLTRRPKQSVWSARPDWSSLAAGQPSCEQANLRSIDIGQRGHTDEHVVEDITVDGRRNVGGLASDCEVTAGPQGISSGPP